MPVPGATAPSPEPLPSRRNTQPAAEPSAGLTPRPKPRVRQHPSASVSASRTSPRGTLCSHRAVPAEHRPHRSQHPRGTDASPVPRAARRHGEGGVCACAPHRRGARQGARSPPRASRAGDAQERAGTGARRGRPLRGGASRRARSRPRRDTAGSAASLPVRGAARRRWRR